MKKVLFLILAAVLIVGAGITGLVASANVAGTAEKTGETAAAESDLTPYVDPISGKLNYLTRQDLTDALDKAVELYFAKDGFYTNSSDEGESYTIHTAGDPYGVFIRKNAVRDFLEIEEIEEMLAEDEDAFSQEDRQRYLSEFCDPIFACAKILLIEKLDKKAASVNIASSYGTYANFFSGFEAPNYIYFSATSDLNGYDNLKNTFPSGSWKTYASADLSAYPPKATVLLS